MKNKNTTGEKTSLIEMLHSTQEMLHFLFGRFVLIRNYSLKLISKWINFLVYRGKASKG